MAFDMEMIEKSRPASFKNWCMTDRDTSLIRDLRYVLHENQTEFWQRFGVSQSRGSRFEQGMAIPAPVLMLIRLYLLRIIDDTDMQRVSSPAYDVRASVPTLTQYLFRERHTR